VSPFQKWLLLGSSGLTGVTGVVYWWMENMLEPVNEWAVINHPLQPWVLKTHIIVAPVLVFAVGLVTVEHIWRHYRRPDLPGRRSGLTAMWVLAPMVLTGYLIQAVTHAGWLSALVWAHLVTGVLYMAGLGVHYRILKVRQAPGAARGHNTTQP
jgi:hypothetical protein